MYSSIQVPVASRRRTMVTSLPNGSLSVEGMIEKPSGSGPIQETSRQLSPPSDVRAHSGRPSRAFDLEAVRKTRQSRGPSAT